MMRSFASLVASLGLKSIRRTRGPCENVRPKKTMQMTARTPMTPANNRENFLFDGACFLLIDIRIHRFFYCNKFARLYHDMLLAFRAWIIDKRSRYIYPIICSMRSLPSGRIDRHACWAGINHTACNDKARDKKDILRIITVRLDKARNVGRLA